MKLPKTITTVIFSTLLCTLTLNAAEKAADPKSKVIQPQVIQTETIQKQTIPVEKLPDLQQHKVIQTEPIKKKTIPIEKLPVQNKPISKQPQHKIPVNQKPTVTLPPKKIPGLDPVQNKFPNGKPKPSIPNVDTNQPIDRGRLGDRRLPIDLDEKVINRDLHEAIEQQRLSETEEVADALAEVGSLIISVERDLLLEYNSQGVEFTVENTGAQSATIRGQVRTRDRRLLLSASESVTIPAGTSELVSFSDVVVPNNEAECGEGVVFCVVDFHLEVRDSETGSLLADKRQQIYFALAYVEDSVVLHSIYSMFGSGFIPRTFEYRISRNHTASVTRNGVFTTSVDDVDGHRTSGYDYSAVLNDKLRLYRDYHEDTAYLNITIHALFDFFHNGEVLPNNNFHVNEFKKVHFHHTCHERSNRGDIALRRSTTTGYVTLVISYSCTRVIRIR